MSDCPYPSAAQAQSFPWPDESALLNQPPAPGPAYPPPANPAAQQSAFNPGYPAPSGSSGLYPNLPGADASNAAPYPPPGGGGQQTGMPYPIAPGGAPGGGVPYPPMGGGGQPGYPTEPGAGNGQRLQFLQFTWLESPMICSNLKSVRNYRKSR